MGKKWFVVLAVMFLCCGAGVFYVMTTPNIDPTRKSGIYMMIVGAVGAAVSLVVKSIVTTDSTSEDGRSFTDEDTEDDDEY
jgi:VanZ family protein